MSEQTPGQLRTHKARKTRIEIKHERWSEEMRSAGYIVLRPETQALLSSLREAAEARVFLDKILSGDIG